MHRRGGTRDRVLLAAAVALVAAVMIREGFPTPEWNPLLLICLAAVPVLIRLGITLESGAGSMLACTAPAILFAADITEPLAFLPWWAVVVLASHMVFYGGPHGIGRGSVEVIAATAMILVARHVDLGLWPLDRTVSAWAVYVLLVAVLQLIRVRDVSPMIVLRGVRPGELATILAGLLGSFTIVELMRRLYAEEPQIATAVVGAATLVSFVAAQLLLSRLHTHQRGIEALTEAGQLMPWPAARVPHLLTTLAQRAVRAQDVRIQAEAGGPGQLSVALADGTHLVASRIRGDQQFSRGEARILRSLAGLADNSRRQTLQAAQLRHQDHTDALTGLANFPHFRFLLERRAADRSPSRLLAVVVLDLDNFAELNTTLGHLETDQVLVSFGERLRHALPRLDGEVVGCRFGGDEFAFMADLHDADAAGSLVERLQRIVEEPTGSGDQLVGLRASFGLATSQDPSDDVDVLLRRAETRMRASKKEGQRTRTASQSAVIEDLLEQNRFSVVLQPLVATRTGQLDGVEALVRVADQTFGALSPLLVVDAAQRTDRLDAMTQAVALQAIDAVLEASTVLGRDLTLTINVELAQLRATSSLLATLEQRVRATGLRLLLEVSERAAGDWTEEHLAVAQQLDSAGIQLAIDDFGAGYATFAMLNSWRWAMVKIDRSLVVGRAPAERRLLVHVYEMLTDLGKVTVAEGIEEIDQLEFATSIGIEWVQGWVVSPPLHPDELLARLRSGATTFTPQSRTIA